MNVAVGMICEWFLAGRYAVILRFGRGPHPCTEREREIQTDRQTRMI